MRLVEAEMDQKSGQDAQLAAIGQGPGGFPGARPGTAASSGGTCWKARSACMIRISVRLILMHHARPAVVVDIRKPALHNGPIPTRRSDESDSILTRWRPTFICRHDRPNTTPDIAGVQQHQGGTLTGKRHKRKGSEKMSWIDWLITILPVLYVLGLAV